MCTPRRTRATEFAATAAVTNTSSAAVTLGTALAVGQTYTGGAGVDTISLTNGWTKAISTGDGNDVVTYAGAAGTGGSVNLGGGTGDVVKMTAALGVTATTDGTFATKVTNFEVLEISDATASAAGLNMAFAGGANSVTLAAGTSGAAYAITNAGAGFTLTQKALNATALSIALAADTPNDTVNLAFTANDGFTNAAAITVSGVENLVITTKDANTTAQANRFIMEIVDTAAKSITVSGDTGVTLTQASTALTSVDASGLTGTGAVGGFTFTSGALAAASTIKGSGAGANTIDFSASVGVVTYTGGSGVDTINFATASTKAHVITLGDGANVVAGGTNGNGGLTITGGKDVDLIDTGSGNDVINAGLGNDVIKSGTGMDVVTGGGGNDTFHFVANSNGNIYTTITDANAGDVLTFVDKGTEVFTSAKITLAGTAVYQDYLNQAASGNGDANGRIGWFQFGGDTFVVQDLSAGTSFVNGTDIVVKLTGLVDLSTATGGGTHILTLV
jgi:S-layer protein